MTISNRFVDVDEPLDLEGFGTQNTGEVKDVTKVQFEAQAAGSAPNAGEAILADGQVKVGSPIKAPDLLVNDKSVGTLIGESVTAESQARDQAIATAVSAEAQARNTAISTAIDQEVTARDQAIATAVGAEAQARNTAISTAIDQEVTARDQAIATAVGGLTKLNNLGNVVETPLNANAATPLQAGMTLGLAFGVIFENANNLHIRIFNTDVDGNKGLKKLFESGELYPHTGNEDDSVPWALYPLSEGRVWMEVARGTGTVKLVSMRVL